MQEPRNLSQSDWRLYWVSHLSEKLIIAKMLANVEVWHDVLKWCNTSKYIVLIKKQLVQMAFWTSKLIT
jgi:hypothetical protein